MPFNVNHTDESIPAYTVYDNTTNTDTSLKFPGRFAAGYGKSIAENFLHLLENFASASEPSNPQVGQLWYDTASGFLRVHSGTGSTVAARWKAASGIEYNLENPGPAKAGQLWVDTANKQLNIYTGSSWMVVGPTISSRDGFKNGALVEDVKDEATSALKTILTIYIADIPVAIISKDSFHPNPPISGFPGGVNSGITLNSNKALFKNGYPTFTGTATAATQLIVDKTAVDASKFLRSDAINNTEFPINIRNNSGLTIGTSSDLIVAYSNASKAATIYNRSEGSIELQTAIDHTPKTILKVVGTSVGINTTRPTAELDVTGNTKVSGKITIAGTDGIGLDITGKVTKGLILDQTQIDSVVSTDQILIYRDGDYLSKTTVANLLASVQQQTQTNALASRKVLQQTTTGLASNASIVLTMAGYKGYALYSVSVDSKLPPNGSIVAGKSIVKIYTSKADADSDVHAIATVTTTDVNQPVRMFPAIVGYNVDQTDTSAIFVKVTNTDTQTMDVTVKLTVLQLEA